MKFSCAKQALGQGLSIVNHAVTARSTLPILSHILFATDHGRLKLSATDLEIGINCWVDAEIGEEGSVTLPAKLMTEFVNTLPQGTVELTLQEESHTVHVKGGRSSATIRGMDPEEFPLPASVEEDTTSIRIGANLLKEVIGQVAFAASSDISRPVLTGVLLQASEEKITFAAADSFRLAVRGVPLALSSPPKGQILVPARTMGELARILPEEGEVQILVTANRSQILFHTEHIDLLSRLIEGTFPNYEHIIPREHTTCAVMNTQEFASAMKSASLFARDDANRTYLTLRRGTGEDAEAAQGSLLIEARAEDVGGGEVPISAQVSGETPELRIVFSAHYIVQVLAALDTPEIALELAGESKPGVIRPIGATDFIYVLMPMSKQR
jgi:DNA polymerase-3 subunit beta